MRIGCIVKWLLQERTENKPAMSNTKKTESFKYRVYNLVFGLLQTRIKYRGERGKKMGEKAIKGKAITKVLGCLVVIRNSFTKRVAQSTS